VHVPLGKGQFRPEPVVVVVLIGDKCIESVITTGKLYEDKDAAILLRGGHVGPDGLGKECGGYTAEGNEAKPGR
jgi:hypothetical protein